MNVAQILPMELLTVFSKPHSGHPAVLTSSGTQPTLLETLLPTSLGPYKGPAVAEYFNWFYTFWNLFRSMIHIAYSDSGARYPGFDTSGKQGKDIISLIA